MIEFAFDDAYTVNMPKHEYVEFFDEATGQGFRFAYDEHVSNELHITVRHGTTPADAILTYFQGNKTWNPDRLRYETESETHVLYWPSTPAARSWSFPASGEVNNEPSHFRSASGDDIRRR